MARRSSAPPPLPAVVISRDEFMRHYWTYRPGEHATFVGPSGYGKTRLMNDLLGVTATRKLQAVVLCMKNRDAETAKFIRETYGFNRAHTWPPTMADRAKAMRNDGTEQRGWVLWPKPKSDPVDRAPQLYGEFRAAFLDSLKRGNRIIVADDMIALSKWLRLGPELSYLYWNGRSDDCGIWGAFQRPAHAPGESYSQSHHIFFANSPDGRDRDRFQEVGGVAGETLRYNLERCHKFQWLYVHRETGGILIIDK